MWVKKLLQRNITLMYVNQSILRFVSNKKDGIKALSCLLNYKNGVSQYDLWEGRQARQNGCLLCSPIRSTMSLIIHEPSNLGNPKFVFSSFQIINYARLLWNSFFKSLFHKCGEPKADELSSAKLIIALRFNCIRLAKKTWRHSEISSFRQFSFLFNSSSWYCAWYIWSC